jgi:hypothetical protein
MKVTFAFGIFREKTFFSDFGYSLHALMDIRQFQYDPGNLPLIQNFLLNELLSDCCKQNPTFGTK